MSMKDEYIKERIGLLKTEMNLLWSAAFVTFGGSFALFLNGTALWHSVFAVAGFLLTLVFVNAFIMRRVESISLINHLDGRK